MPFELTFLTPVILVWLMSSWVAYRVVASTKLENRDWTDRTLPRRIIWVILGPISLVGFLGFAVCLITYDVIMALKEHLKVFRDRRRNRPLTRRRREAKERRERFFTTAT